MNTRWGNSVHKRVSGLTAVALIAVSTLALSGCVGGGKGSDAAPSPLPASGGAPGQDASAAATLPNLPAETATFLGPTAILPTHVGKLIGYKVTLAGGWSMLAVQGAPANVVPTVVHEPSYHGTSSGLYQSGPYVLFFPDLSAAPATFTKAASKPGMTSLDPAAYK